MIKYRVKIEKCDKIIDSMIFDTKKEAETAEAILYLFGNDPIIDKVESWTMNQYNK